MQLITVSQIAFATLLYVTAADSQGYKCPNSNYRIFVVHAGLDSLWNGKLEDAATMCRKAGHVLAKSASCLVQFGLNQTASANIDEAWVDQGLKRPEDSACTIWSRDKNFTSVKCEQSAKALCQGLSSEDNTLHEIYNSGAFPYTQIFGATTPSPQPSVDTYYVLCGVFGVILISIVIAAAIWRSGYVNNRYSFRRLPPNAAAAAAAKNSAPKSHTVTSQLDSEIPPGYVKASVTKETIA